MQSSDGWVWLHGLFGCGRGKDVAKKWLHNRTYVRAQQNPDSQLRYP
jgi:hypothetical protein